MSTYKQKKANQRNAKRSTGPKTEEGKRASRMNAQKHGLTGDQIVIAGEDPAEFDAYRERCIQEHAPETVMEQELVELIAADIWRLKRIPILEKSIIEYFHLDIECQDSHFDVKVADKLIDDANGLIEKLESNGKVEQLAEYQQKAVEAFQRYWTATEAKQQPFPKLGRALVAEGKGLDALGKLSRYERDILRVLERRMDKLEALQEKRMKTIEPGD